ncbi:MAG: TraR/DksA family transcriptional regulator [Myxococcales bacterium]|nr:TraR/DksA family transcriptional regulator [Myxococcales bacterium]
MTEPTPTPHADVRANFEARLETLINRVDAIERNLRRPGNPDWQESVTERENDEVLEGLDVAGLKDIAAIRAAIVRIDEGVFGMCVRCGEDIAPGRLKALPASPLCIECARAAD